MINIVYFGTPLFSAVILEHLLDNIKNNHLNFNIKAVVTSPDKPVGRHQTLTKSPVAVVADKYQIPILKPAILDDEFIKNHVSLLGCDLIIVASYGKIIPQILLDIPRLGALNVHGSILPRYRGASPIQAAILNGDDSTGLTIMLMDAKMDHGPILATKVFSISPQDNYVTLSKKMSEGTVPFLIDTALKYLEGKITPIPQNHQQATFTKLLKKDIGYIDITNPPSAEVLNRMIRAYYPWPNVWTKYNGKIIKLFPDSMVQMEGKKPIKLTDFLHGYPNFPLQSY